MTSTFPGLAGQPLEYLDHPYNVTAANERAVEVPLTHQLLDLEGHRCSLDRRPFHVLEVGNVLAHYPGAPPRSVIDLHERGPGVLNVDVNTWTPPHRFDAIVAVSTIEHVGWDHPDPHPQAAAAAVARLRSWLAADGALLVTIPIGYHPPLDRLIARRALLAPLTDTLYLRDGPGTSWLRSGDWRRASELDRSVILADHPYDRATPTATALWVGRWTA